MEDTNKSKRHQKLFRICKLLLTIHQGFQPYRNIIKPTKRKRKMKMDKWRTRSIWRSKKKDNHITSTSPTQKRKKIQGRSRYIRTCNWRSFFIRTRRQMKTSHLSIKNNVTCGKKLQDIWQGTTGNSQSTRQMVAIPTRYSWEIWSINRPQKLKVLQRTAQTQ